MDVLTIIQLVVSFMLGGMFGMLAMAIVVAGGDKNGN